MKIKKELGFLGHDPVNFVKLIVQFQRYKAPIMESNGKSKTSAGCCPCCSDMADLGSNETEKKTRLFIFYASKTIIHEM